MFSATPTFAQGPSVSSHGVNLKINLTLEQAMKAQKGEQMYSSTLPSTSTLDGGGWSTPRPDRFTPSKDPVPVV